MENNDYTFAELIERLKQDETLGDDAETRGYYADMLYMQIQS